MDNEKTTMKLDDAQRVRVLSPGMLVAKRFFRNRLAIAGLVIIVCMFLFSFVGGLVMPYSESQVFYTTEEMKKDYAGATYIEDFQLFAADGATLPSDTFSKMILAITKGEYVFQTRDGQNLGLGLVDDDIYMVYAIEQTTNPEALLSEEYAEAAANGSNQFNFDGTEYLFDGTGIKATLYTTEDLALACKMSVTSYDSDTTFSYDFYKNVLLAMGSGETSAEADGVTYTIEALGEDAARVHTADGTNYAYVSNMNINSVTSGVFLTPDFKEALKLAIDENEESFEYTDENGETDTYLIAQKNGQYTIQRYQETRVIDTYAAPSKEHWCGTDANGMDLLARLMYGGRISLLIGFVVVFIELIIGVIVGGIAGFFGGWVDNVLMRFVDIVYCIPAMPLYLILGSIMDYYKASSTVRIYMLCIIMSIVGWVSIARIVRGQILSLREQEFMTAAEATGISIRRRIFKHLVPNVIPQLVVFASMGIGDVILAESTLSFLGLGIKYPAASWGSIINAVTDSYVMTNYLFVWIPAGMLILLTVLAFNFIGDGLRDAFDPKMKR
jgi:peptide/nickel transport system permease protein